MEAGGASKDSKRTVEKINVIRERIKSYPDFPKQGILFRDVFPLAHHPTLIPTVVELLHERLASTYPQKQVDMVVGIDSRGFLFGPDLARVLGVDFVPARKKGKLPGDTISQSYDLEYGSAAVEIQKEYMAPGKSAVIVDDLIATGGTMAAVHSLLSKSGVEVVECQCIVELPELEGRKKLPKDCNLHCLVDFEGE